MKKVKEFEMARTESGSRITRKTVFTTLSPEQHIREKNRLNQALHGKLDEIVTELTATLIKHNIDAMPGVMFDVFLYTAEEIHLDKFKSPVEF